MTEHPAFSRLRKLIAMAEAGKLDKQIAHALGCHKQYVLGARKALGIDAPAKKRSYTEAFREEVRAAVRGGARMSEAARRFGVSPCTIFYWLKKDRKNDRG